MAEGPDVTVGAIARHAGVSESAFFSYFASKDDLIAELVSSRYEAWLALAQRRGDGTACERLEAFVWEMAADAAPHRVYLDTERLLRIDERSRDVADAFHCAVTRLIGAAGTREGLTSHDLLSAVLVATLAAAPYLHARPELWRRFVAVVVAGLRA